MRWLFLNIFLVAGTLAIAQTPKEWIESANKKVSEGNSLGAIKDFTAALEQEPDNAEALTGRGIVQAEVLDYEAALADLRKATTIDSQFALAYFNLGYVYFQQEQLEESLNAYNRYIALHPEDANGYLARGEVRVHLGQEELANADFEKFVNLPLAEDEDLLGRSKAYLYLGKPEKSLEAINLYINRNPEASRAYLQRADLYTNVFEDFEKAVSDYTIYLLEFTESKEAYVSRAAVYFAMKNVDAAINDYTRAINLDPLDGELYIDRGYAYLEKEEFEKAHQDFTKALTLDIYDRELAYYNKGISEYRLGKKTEACESWSKAGEMAETQRSQFCK